jgi:hypothetical protein
VRTEHGEVVVADHDGGVGPELLDPFHHAREGGVDFFHLPLVGDFGIAGDQRVVRHDEAANDLCHVQVSVGLPPAGAG